MKKMIFCPSRIKGSVKISGSKNSTLPILAASLVSCYSASLENIPNISDVNNLLIVLEKIGCTIKRKGSKLKTISSVKNVVLDFEEITKFRASYYLMSVYLSLFKEVSIILPGGCNIGRRPIDFHLKGFEAAGCKFYIDEDKVRINAKRLYPFIHKLPKKSLGATVNLIILASKIDGKSVIENASTEPEIDDLISFINKGKAHVFRVKDDIVIYGDSGYVKNIKHRIIPDRIEAFTYICIGVNSEKLKIKNINLNHLQVPLNYMKNANLLYKAGKNSLVIFKSKLNPINVFSSNYPYLSTDQMPLMYPLFTRVLGCSSFKEEIFTDRFLVCDELKKTNANIEIKNNTVFICGNDSLIGNEFYSTDLRCAASLLIECLINGNSTLHNLSYLERGYDDVYNKLRKIGAKFKIE